MIKIHSDIKIRVNKQNVNETSELLKNNTDGLSKMSLIFTLLWFCCETVRFRFPFPVVCISYLIWFTLSVLKYPEFVSEIIRKSWLMIFWVLNIVIRTIFGISILTNEMIYAVVLLMIYYIFLFYKSRDINFRKVIFYTIIVGYTITALYTLYYLSLDTNLVRRSAAGFLETSSYINTYGSGLKNIGGFDYIYSITGVTICCLYLFRKVNNKYKASIYLLLSILFIVVVIQSSLSTAVLLLLILIFLFFVPQQQTYKILYFIIVITVLSLMLPLIDNVLYFLSNVIENENFAYKINEAINFFSGNNSFSEFYSRSLLSKYSFETFSEYPLLGIYGFEDYAYTSLPNVVSGHVQWIDDLARYGVLFCIIFFYQSILIYRELVDFSKDKLHLRLTNILMFFVLSLGFLNPTLFIHIYILLFVVLPFSSSVKDNEMELS